jgi:hypothetical protein
MSVIPVVCDVSSISAGTPPPPVSFSSYGMLQVNWTVNGTLPANIKGYTVTVEPFNEREEFTAPFVTNPWCPWIFVSPAAARVATMGLCARAHCETV